MCNSKVISQGLDAVSEATGLNLTSQQISTIVCIFQASMAAITAFQATYSQCMGQGGTGEPTEYAPGARPRC